jgi:hypothetical protein
MGVMQSENAFSPLSMEKTTRRFIAPFDLSIDVLLIGVTSHRYALRYSFGSRGSITGRRTARVQRPGAYHHRPHP